MRTYFFLSISLFILIFFGCDKNSSVTNSEEESDNKKGGISLIIDKQNAPSNVVIVRALLTRENYENISGELNILTDSTADIFLENIYAGEWHLLVEALNENETVVYRGETDVTVLEGITTQVNLVLYPTGEGLGSIYILVSWGESGWIDFPGNPVLTTENNPLNPITFIQPKVLFQDGIYKMWFTNLFNSASGNVGYAQSENGISWEIYSEAALQTGEAGSWDDYLVGSGAIMKDESLYKMYYYGFRDQYGKWNTGLATSSDGLVWDKNGEPVLNSQTVENQLIASDILKVGNLYYLYFTERNVPYYSIGLALSENGVNWVLYENNPVLTAVLSWENTGVYSPSVIYENNQFKMVYMNSLASGFGMAVSDNGKNWKKEGGNPFFTPEKSYNNWCKRIAYPFFRKFGNECRIYYTGYDMNNNTSFGVLRKF